jgi:hypothetical protein
MLRLRINKRLLWILAVLVILPLYWVLQVEVTYERNIKRGIPANFEIQRPHVIEMWKV